MWTVFWIWKVCYIWEPFFIYFQQDGKSSPDRSRSCQKCRRRRQRKEKPASLKSEPIFEQGFVKKRVNSRHSQLINCYQPDWFTLFHAHHQIRQQENLTSYIVESSPLTPPHHLTWTPRGWEQGRTQLPDRPDNALEVIRKSIWSWGIDKSWLSSIYVH